MQLVVTPQGHLLTIYTEAISLPALGQMTISRGSHVEPTSDGRWSADLSPVDGPCLGPFLLRSEALAAEVAWLEAHWLVGGRT